MRSYRVVTEVYIDDGYGGWEKITSIGDVVEAESFAESLPTFNKALNKQWAQVANLAPVVDEEPDMEPEAKGGGA